MTMVLELKMLIQIGGGGLKGDMLLKMSRLEAHILRTGGSNAILFRE